MTVGGFAAGMAALLLLVYLSNYRKSVNGSGESMTVLVAKSLIEKGTPGDVVGLKGLFQTSEAPQSQLKDGAVTDPATLHGRLATSDIYPGQQLTTGDFAASADGAIGTQIAGKQRAISVPVDSAHGMVGQVRAGDRVDILAGFNVSSGAGAAASRPVLKVITQNVLVLDAPDRSGTGVGASSTSDILLRTEYQQALEIAWAADNGRLWIVLRPRAGAPVERPGIVTPESLLLGVRPVTVSRKARKLVGGRP
ncbi:MAG TPA: Flp pilus assembly protein CpaB [Gaiellaceae bacterium]|nr:Flp pilus assembly protein CpaB [Gaiellaceae bacterium]